MWGFDVQEADVLKDKELCIIQGNSDYTKQQLEQEIVRLGGSVVQNAGQFQQLAIVCHHVSPLIMLRFLCVSLGTNTFCIVAPKINLKVRNYMSSQKYNIVNVDWLCQCITEQRFIEW